MSMPKRILITGSSGYGGTALVRRLDAASDVEEIIGWDRLPPREMPAKLRFERADVAESALRYRMRALAPDALVHLAFVVDPLHDRTAMFRTNVVGTQNVLAAAAAAHVPRLVVASSATAYGAFPDNPVPLRETDPCRPHPTFQYAREKAWLERDFERFRRSHPETSLAILRPCVVFGPRVDNYIADLLTGLPLAVGLADYDPPLQFVHEEDVAGVTTAILREGASGPFNVAPPDTILASEAVSRRAVPRVMLPQWLLGPMVQLTWTLRLPVLRTPPSFLDFLRYPWVVDTTRVQQELRYRYRYSSRETLDVMLESKGRRR